MTPPKDNPINDEVDMEEYEQDLFDYLEWSWESFQEI